MPRGSFAFFLASDGSVHCSDCEQEAASMRGFWRIPERIDEPETSAELANVVFIFDAIATGAGSAITNELSCPASCRAFSFLPARKPWMAWSSCDDAFNQTLIFAGHMLRLGAFRSRFHTELTRSPDLAQD